MPTLLMIDTDPKGQTTMIAKPRSLVLFSLLIFTLISQAAAQVTFAYTFNGDSHGDRFGIAVSDAGDVNGDGFADVIVGAYIDDNNGPASGSARVFSGLDGNILYTFNGDSSFDQLGTSVSGAGDVNGDGFADVIVGVPDDDNNGFSSGSARVFSGLDGSIIYNFNGGSTGDQFGLSVSDAGDVNGDGVVDLIVGAYLDDNNGNDSGSARVLSGLDGSILYTFHGGSAGDQFGVSVSGAGDVNGDGFADVIVGAQSDDNNGSASGSARVLSGLNGSILYAFNGDSADDRFGRSVSDAGDVNGDGFADVIVGALLDDNNGSDSGSARVFSGMDGSILYTFNGDSVNDFFGTFVSGAGDVNGDGLADVIVGAQSGEINGIRTGIARVFSGLDGSILYDFNGESADDYFGVSVSGAGDVNGDGFADVIIGVPGDDNNGSNSGSARVFTAPTLPVLNYRSAQGFVRLDLAWIPNNNDINAVVGTLSCDGATPGGLGIVGVSLAPADILIYGCPLLIAVDSTNFVSSANFGFDFFGQLSAPNISRQAPALAGFFAHIQFFENSPIPSCSNAIRLALVP